MTVKELFMKADLKKIAASVAADDWSLKIRNDITDEEKDAVYKNIITITEQIKNIRKEIRFCNEIEKSVPVIKKEIKKVEEREKKQKEFTKNKKKERRYER